MSVRWHRSPVAEGGQDPLLAKLGDRGTEHHPGRGLGKGHTRRLGHERNRATGARVGLKNVEHVLGQRELNVHQAPDPNSSGQLERRLTDSLELLLAEGHRRQHTGRVA